MDGWGQIGPEKGSYDEDLRHLAKELWEGNVFVKLADRGTQYELYLTVKRELRTPFSFPDGLGGVDEEDIWLLVARPRYGAGWFKLDGSKVAPSYVNEVMGFKALGDGEVVSEFLEALSERYRAML